MEVLVVIVLIIIALAVCSAAFNSGKREGSRKAYGVGYARGRRQRGRAPGGCLVAVLVGLAMFGTAGIVLACVL